MRLTFEKEMKERGKYEKNIERKNERKSEMKE